MKIKGKTATLKRLSKRHSLSTTVVFRITITRADDHIRLTSYTVSECEASKFGSQPPLPPPSSIFWTLFALDQQERKFLCFLFARKHDNRCFFLCVHWKRGKMCSWETVESLISLMGAILFDNLSCQYPNQPSSSHRQEQSRDLKKVPRIENCWTEQVF